MRKDVLVAHQQELATVLARLRAGLEVVFRPDTAAQGFSGTVPSTGHCAAVATIIHTLLGGELLSTMLYEQSHWFNRLHAANGVFDVDLTGDQFLLPPLQIRSAGQLYQPTHVRHLDELSVETLRRAQVLATRAKLLVAERRLATRIITSSKTIARR